MAAETMVTGGASGLGRYLVSRAHLGEWPGPGHEELTRDNAESLLESHRSRALGTIIHCAFDRSPQAIAENVALTEKLVILPHERFILMSSCDVYSAWPADETSPIDIDRLRTSAARAKALCEETVISRASRPLILRATSLLGHFSKPSNLLRILYENAPELTLTADSTWNIVLHEDVRQFMEKAVQAGLEGIYNLAAASSIRVDEIASKLGKSPRYGEFKYAVGEISNQKAAAMHEPLGLDSWEQVQRFLRPALPSQNI